MLFYELYLNIYLLLSFNISSLRVSLYLIMYILQNVVFYVSLIRNVFRTYGA